MKRFIVLLVMSVLVVGCATQTAAPTNVPAAAPSPTPSPTTQDAAAPTPAGGLWIQPGVPVDLAEAARAAFSDVPEVDAEAESTVRITLNPTDSPVAAERIFALVGPFATVRDELTWQAFTTYWQTGSGLDEAPTLVMTPATADMLIALLGPTGSAPVQLVEPAALTGTLWDFRPALGVVPFDQLEPAQKALTVDGVSLLEPDADLSGYPLRVTVGASGPGVEGLAWAPTNRDPARISSVVLTGTTAIARATAMQVELNGVGFPAAQIAPFFAGVDILHTSNESSYAVDCPPPDWYGEPKFCSQRAYFEVLTTTGVDIVEKTGNHIADYGRSSLVYTLDVYDNNAMIYYGGGRSLSDARAPRILTTGDGTRVAFVGCNSAGPFPVWATDQSAGAAPCDDWSAITQTIAELKESEQADVIIATLQYLELASYTPSEQQVADFARLTAAGADIVSGSQAHQPQGFAFDSGGFIHYGIGNLFFDQMDFIENRQMFADKHILYEGRHIGTVLFTGLMEDWAQPRPMTPEERADFLQLIFEASGW